MSIAIIEEPCFLCGTNAKWQESEFSKRRHYLCSNPSCGEYEISLAAMERVKNNTEFKKQASAMASCTSDSQQILEIVTTTGPDKQVTAILVKRRSSLGGTN